MEIIKKAYECTFNDWNDVESLGVTRHFETDWIYSEIVYGETANKAKHSFFLNMDFDDKNYIDVKCRRVKHHDLVKQIPHVLTEKLTDEQKRKMFHAIGYDDRRIENTFYRNYYQCEYDSDLEAAIEHGLITKAKSTTGLPFYYLTELGLEVIISLTPKKRCYLHDKVDYSEFL